MISQGRMAGGIHPSGSSRAECDVEQTRFCARSPTPRRPVTGCRPRHPRRVGTASADPARLSLAAVMGPGRFHAGDVDTDGELVARVPDSTIPPGTSRQRRVATCAATTNNRTRAAGHLADPPHATARPATIRIKTSERCDAGLILCARRQAKIPSTYNPGSSSAA